MGVIKALKLTGIYSKHPLNYQTILRNTVVAVIMSEDKDIVEELSRKVEG
jgi:hypothetical protein